MVNGQTHSVQEALDNWINVCSEHVDGLAPMVVSTEAQRLQHVLHDISLGQHGHFSNGYSRAEWLYTCELTKHPLCQLILRKSVTPRCSLLTPDVSSSHVWPSSINPYRIQPVEDHPLCLSQTSKWNTYFKVREQRGLCSVLLSCNLKACAVQL